VKVKAWVPTKAASNPGKLAVRAQSRSSFDLQSFLATFGEGRTIRKYSKGDVVFLQGAAADAIFYIQKGKVKATVVSEQGREAVSGILGPNEFFGEGCIAGQVKRVATLVAMTDAVIMHMEKAGFIQALHREPALADMFILRILTRSIRVEADLVDQLFNSSEKRLARLLLLMADFGNKGDSNVVIAKVSQETLAEMIGTTRSRVNFFMNKFRKLEMIDYKDRIEVRRSLLDFVLHDQPQIRI
jgi:CRP-like cAMP-binding protein